MRQQKLEGRGEWVRWSLKYVISSGTSDVMHSFYDQA
jgi:hypothetical protein